MAKFVSDVLDIDNVVEKHGNMIFLVAGVGSGKSSWVKEVLTKKGNVLFITSRKAKVEEDLHDSCFTEYFKWHTNDNQTLITNAKLHSMVTNISQDSQKDLNEFLTYFDYIVIDEVHSVATDSSFAGSCYGVLAFMEYAVNKGCVVIAMTGTPEPIEWYFKSNNWYCLDYRRTCNYVHPDKIYLWNKRGLPQKISECCNNNKIVYFANNTDSIIQLCTELLAIGSVNANEIATIVSRSKEKIFNEKLKKNLTKDFDAIDASTQKTYKSLIEKKKIPDECKILISTSTLREGVDIENDKIIMFCENHILSNLVQFLGRARKPGCIVYIIEDSTDHAIEHKPLLFDYAIQAEINAANAYLKSHIQTTGNAFVDNEKMQLIKHVCKNPYIEFNYIEDIFTLFDVKFIEEERLKNIINWKLDLDDYCKTWDIPFIGDKNRKKTFETALHRMYEQRGEYSIEHKDLIIHMLNIVYNITDEQPSAINKKLTEAGLDFRIIYDKWNKKPNRNKTYWKFVSIDEHQIWSEKKQNKIKKKSQEDK